MLRKTTLPPPLHRQEPHLAPPLKNQPVGGRSVGFSGAWLTDVVRNKEFEILIFGQKR